MRKASIGTTTALGCYWHTSLALPRPSWSVPSQLAMGSPHISNTDLQFIIGIAITALFGILGVAGVIPLGFALLSIALVLPWVGWALWRSEWLSSKTKPIRALIVILIVIVYSASAFPAIIKLAHRQEDQKHAPTVPVPNQNANDCSQNFAGDGNKGSVNCGDKSNK